MADTSTLTPREIVAELDTCFGDSVDDVDFDTYADLNAQFHSELAGLSGSEVVRREVEREFKGRMR